MKKIIITSPGAGGKNFLIDYLDKVKNLKLGISYTTRPPRFNEVDGVHYHFISKELFKEMISKGLFLEYNKFKDWMYGTSFEEYNSKEVFIMTPNVLSSLNRSECFIIYLNISEKTRRYRLQQRNDKNDDVERRLKADKEDFMELKDFDLEVTDDNFICEEIYKKIML